MINNANHKILRISSIIDNPVPIESLFNLEKYNLLAVGRSDNTIEIWNTDTWVQLIKINGTQSINIKKVFMIKKERKGQEKNLFANLRLFSIGTNGYLIEWSIHTGEPRVKYCKFIFRSFTKIREVASGTAILQRITKAYCSHATMEV